MILLDNYDKLKLCELDTVLVDEVDHLITWNEKMRQKITKYPGPTRQLSNKIRTRARMDIGPSVLDDPDPDDTLAPAYETISSTLCPNPFSGTVTPRSHLIASKSGGR